MLSSHCTRKANISSLPNQYIATLISKNYLILFSPPLDIVYNYKIYAYRVCYMHRFVYTQSQVVIYRVQDLLFQAEYMLHKLVAWLSSCRSSDTYLLHMNICSDWKIRYKWVCHMEKNILMFIINIMPVSYYLRSTFYTSFNLDLTPYFLTPKACPKCRRVSNRIQVTHSACGKIRLCILALCSVLLIK